MWVPKHRADTQVRPYGDRTRHNPSLTCPGLRDYKTAYPAIPRRHAMKPTYSTILAIALFFLTGCASNSFMYKDFPVSKGRSEEHTSELQSRLHLVCRLLLEKKKNINFTNSEMCDTAV